jgi:hypothetical protein
MKRDGLMKSIYGKRIYTGDSVVEERYLPFDGSPSGYSYAGGIFGSSL